MDCRTANEYINAYADSMLNKKEAEQLFSHISSCSKCKKDFDDISAVKKALAGLREIEPPAGLALSAIKKAKKRRIPVFAYASAGVAAAIALVAVFSSGILNNNSYDMDTKLAAPSAYSQKTVADMEMQNAAASMAPMASMEAPEGGLALAPQATSAPAEESVTAAEDGEIRTASVPFINVPAEVSDSFRDQLEEFLAESNIEYEIYDAEDVFNISFIITEEKLADLKSLIEQSFNYEGELNAGTVEFIFNK